MKDFLELFELHAHFLFGKEESLNSKSQTLQMEIERGWFGDC